MLHVYVKKLKVGDLAEGEYPYSVVQLSHEDENALLAEKEVLLKYGYEESDGSEYEHQDDYLKKE